MFKKTKYYNIVTFDTQKSTYDSESWTVSLTTEGWYQQKHVSWAELQDTESGPYNIWCKYGRIKSSTSNIISVIQNTQTAGVMVAKRDPATPTQTKNIWEDLWNDGRILVCNISSGDQPYGQYFWLLIMRSQVRFLALPWGFFPYKVDPQVTMVWVVSII
jgi:hypothetical protein